MNNIKINLEDLQRQSFITSLTAEKQAEHKGGFQDHPLRIPYPEPDPCPIPYPEPDPWRIPYPEPDPDDDYNYHEDEEWYYY